MKKLFLLIILFNFSENSHASSMEAVNLLKIFSLDKSVDYNIYDWATGADKESPIEWQHSGIKSTPPDSNYGYSFYRDGTVVVTNSGEVTHKILAKKIKDGAWNIRLTGIRSGYSNVELSPNAATYEHPSFYIDKKYILKKIECDGPVSDSIAYELIKFTGKKPFWLKSESSSGSAGGSTSYTIIYDETPKCDSLLEDEPKEVIADTRLSSDSVVYSVTYNKNGAVLASTSDEKVYLGKDCDSFSKKHGKGTWGWANGGFKVMFNNKDIGFPRQEIDIPNISKCRF